MMIFFTEDDMITFGGYMLSEERELSTSALVNEGKIAPDKRHLVNQADLENWARIMTERNNE